MLKALDNIGSLVICIVSDMYKVFTKVFHSFQTYQIHHENAR